MSDQKSNKIKSYIQDPELFKNMRIDLLRGSIIGFVATIILLILILKVYEQSGGLHAPIFLISGLIGSLIVLYKPGRPAQINRRTFSIPKEYTDYEKKLEEVMLYLRKRSAVVCLSLPYFLWLFYVMFNQEIRVNSDLDTLLGSALLSFLFTLIAGSCIQYFQVWLALQKEKQNER